ncbi:MAG: PAS domain S-box protein [Halobacteriota archaeon]
MIRIILVVDDPNSAQDIQNRLQRMCYDVIALTATADEVITRADALRPDIILMDVRLKGEADGIEVAQQIKSLHDIPVIFIAANPDEATVRRAIAAEADGFLIEPLDELELIAAIDVATRKYRKERQARVADSRLREITDALPVVVYEADETGRITFVNATASDMSGYTKEELEAGMSIFQLIVPADLERARTASRRRMGGEDVGRVEYTGLRKDGRTFPVSALGVPKRRDGAVVGQRGILLDMTELKRAEQKVRESARRIRELTESLSEVIFETDMVGNLTFVNRAGLKEFGYTKEQVEGGMTLYDFVPPDKHEEIRESIAQAVIDEPSEWIELPGLRRDGSTFPVSVRASVIVREGVPVGIRGIAVNVTEQKRADQKMEESERRIRELTDALPAVVYETDAIGRVTFANATAFDMFGYTKEELEAGISIFQLIAPADLERARAVFHRRLGGEDVGRVEYTGLRKDGSTFPVSIRAVQMRRDGAIVGQRGIILDITERKRAEERVKERTHTIETLNRIITEGNRTSDVQSFAEAATKLACELMRFDIGGIYLIDMDSRYATLRYAQGPPETARDAIEKISYRDAPYSAILIDGDPLFADDYATFLPRHAPFGVASLASVPLYSQDAIIGALNVGSATRHTFSQAEKELLIAIGNEVGTVIAKLQADEALKESERRIREITDALPVVVYEADETGRVTFANATAFDMFGYTKEELEAGMSIFQLITDADKERARTVFHRRTSFDDVGLMEYTGLRKDGRTFPVSALGAPIRRDGAAVGVRGAAVDITERKRAEERVKERTHTIETLNRIITEGNRATQVQSFAKTVADLTLELLHFDVGTIHLHDYDARRANLCYATGIPDIALEAIRNIPLDDMAYGRVLVEGKPLFVGGHEALRVPHAAELGVKSLAVVPLYRYDKRIGALTVGSFARHTFSQAEKELLNAISNEVGVVIAKLQADELIRITLKEKETLLKEIHHRVKNNMQVISSLISLQAQQATELETVEMLKESQSRIRSMALIHEKLYRSGSLAEIDFGDYVDSIIDELLRMFNVAPGAITITTDVENVLFGVDTAIPCALIINELVSNSLKHAFPDGATGEVTITLHQINGTYELTVADNGEGLPPNFDFRATDSLGMQLVTALVNQLDGTITLDRTKGTTFITTFTPAGARIGKSGRE